MSEPVQTTPLTDDDFVAFNAVLGEVGTQALETMAFLCCEPADPSAEAPDEPVVVTMGFTGTRSGTVQMVTGRQFGQHLAANALGTTPDDAQAAEQSIDAIRELINVIVGALMPHLTGNPHDVFDLTLPYLEPFNEQLWEGIQATGCVLDAEGQTTALRLLPPAA